MKQFIQMTDLKVGESIRAIGFECIPQNSICEISEDGGDLYVVCAEGHHYLEGQRDDETGECIGLYKEYPIMVGLGR